MAIVERVVRREQQGKQDLRRAQRDTSAEIESEQGAYEADRTGCDERRWETPYDDANTVRLQFFQWTRGGVLHDFVINVQLLTSNGWETVEYFDCCHGHFHLHSQNGGKRSIYTLDDVNGVRRAMSLVGQEADARARIIRGNQGV